MAQDPLTYAQLSESNITSKLPEIAYRQYQIGEAKREKKKKEATDLAAAFKEQKDTWDADNIYLKKTWERNVNAASEYFGRTGDADGARLMFLKGQNLSNALVSSASDQQKLYDIAAKQQLENQKIMGKDPEGFKRDAEMLQQYVTLNGVPKEVYNDVRKRFSIPKEMTDEEIRPLVRQEYFKDKQLISFTPLPSFQEGISEYALNPEAYSSIYKSKVGDIEGVTTAHGTKYNPEALKKQKELFWDFGREKNSGIQYKLDYIRTLKQTNPNITEAEAKQHFMNNKSWDELLKKGAESSSISFNERNKSDNFNFGAVGGYKTDKVSIQPYSGDMKTPLGTKPTAVLTLDKIGSDKNAVSVTNKGNIYEYDNGVKTNVTTAGTVSINNPKAIWMSTPFEGNSAGWYLIGTGYKDEKPVELMSYIPDEGTWTAIASDLGVQPNVLTTLATRAMKMNAKRVGATKSAPTQQKTNTSVAKNNKIGVKPE